MSFHEQAGDARTDRGALAAKNSKQMRAAGMRPARANATPNARIRSCSPASSVVAAFQCSAALTLSPSSTAITPSVIAALVTAACMKMACTVVISTPLAIVQPQGAKACA